MTFTVYPAVDISGGRCARPLRTRTGSETAYSDDPVQVAMAFSDAGARWLHVVDLDGARTGVSSNRELLLQVIRRCACPVQAGGGLRTRDDVGEVLEAGAHRAVLGAFALEDEIEVSTACREFGPRITASIDARDGQSPAQRWTVGTGRLVPDVVKAFEAAGVSSFIYTDVGQDGTMQGPQLGGLRRLLDVTSHPVIASGGIGSLDDLRAVAGLHARGVVGAVVGRALYERAFTVEQANRAADEVVDPRSAL